MLCRKRMQSREEASLGFCPGVLSSKSLLTSRHFNFLFTDIAFFVYITMCLHCYDHIVFFFIFPCIFVDGRIVERKFVNDPYYKLLFKGQIL